MSTLSIKFRQEYGDHAAGAVVPFPEGMARHLVGCGLADFIPADEAAPAVDREPVIERADAPKPKNVQRASK